MKPSALFLGALAIAVLLPATSHAALVTVTNTFVSPGSYRIDGLLSQDATATFEFSIAGPNPNTGAYSGYTASMSPSPAVNTPYTLGTASVQGSFGSVAPTTQNTLTFYYPTGASTNNPVLQSNAVVMATAFMVDPTHEDVTFSNDSPLTAGFTALVNFNAATQLGAGELVSASSLSSVPLPASFPLLMMAVLGLVTFGYYRKSSLS